MPINWQLVGVVTPIVLAVIGGAVAVGKIDQRIAHLEEGINNIQPTPGKKGEKGERGEQGLPGEKGDKGDPGDSSAATLSANKAKKSAQDALEIVEKLSIENAKYEKKIEDLKRRYSACFALGNDLTIKYNEQSPELSNSVLRIDVLSGDKKGKFCAIQLFHPNFNYSLKTDLSTSHTKCSYLTFPDGLGVSIMLKNGFENKCNVKYTTICNGVPCELK